MTTLTAIRAALQSSKSEHVALFTSLLEEGKLTTWKSLLSSQRQFGATEVERVNFGKKQSSFGVQKLPTLQELQEICIRDLPNIHTLLDDKLAENAPHNSPKGAEHAASDETAMQFMTKLVDTTFDATRDVVTFYSEALHERCSQAVPIPENLLLTTTTTCDIIAGHTFLPLQHNNEGTTITTLISGTLVWIIWPSTPHNLHLVQHAYSNYAQDSNEAHMDIITPHLQGGVIFVQEQGDGLHIPPLCPMLCLSTTSNPSILAKYTHLTYPQFFYTLLHHLPFLNTYYTTLPPPPPPSRPPTKQLKSAKAEFSASLVRFLSWFLVDDEKDNEKEKDQEKNGNYPLLHDNNDPLRLRTTPRQLLLRTWDKFRRDLAAVLRPADGRALLAMWVDFLKSVNKAKTCALCQEAVCEEEGGIKEHFLARHWQARGDDHGDEKE